MPQLTHTLINAAQDHVHNKIEHTNTHTHAGASNTNDLPPSHSNHRNARPPRPQQQEQQQQQQRATPVHPTNQNVPVVRDLSLLLQDDEDVDEGEKNAQ